MGGFRCPPAPEAGGVKYRLVLRPEVESDLLEAEQYYETREPGLGKDLVRAVRELLRRLPRNALLYRVRHKRKQVRWAYPRRFPHRVIFRIEEDTIVIYAVLHAARHDRHWKRRV